MSYPYIQDGRWIKFLWGYLTKKTAESYETRNRVTGSGFTIDQDGQGFLYGKLKVFPTLAGEGGRDTASEAVRGLGAGPHETRGCRGRDAPCQGWMFRFNIAFRQLLLVLRSVTRSQRSPTLFGGGGGEHDP